MPLGMNVFKLARRHNAPITHGSTRYAADAVVQSHTVAGVSRYNTADLATRIELGPFAAEFPPEERLGGR